MEPKHEIALEQALAWINDNYKPVGIIVSGSIIRGNPDANSDFDIYVIHQEKFRQRVQKYFNQVPCEIFINTLNSAYWYLEDELKSNRPVTAHMISTGKIFMGSDHPDFLKLFEAAKSYSLRTLSLTAQQLISYKFSLANLLEDASDVLETDEQLTEHILNKLVSDIIEFSFRLKEVPLPRIKERLRALHAIDPTQAELISKYYLCHGVKEKYNIAVQILINLDCNEGFFEWSSDRE